VPQALTACVVQVEEHLQLFATFKGVDRAGIPVQVANMIQNVSGYKSNISCQAKLGSRWLIPESCVWP
jgi:hypothetical protein